MEVVTILLEVLLQELEQLLFFGVSQVIAIDIGELQYLSASDYFIHCLLEEF
jgi:hypothetical protein